MGLYQLREIGREALPACERAIREGVGTGRKVVEEFGLTAENCPSNGGICDVALSGTPFSVEGII